MHPANACCLLFHVKIDSALFIISEGVFNRMYSYEMMMYTKRYFCVLGMTFRIVRRLEAVGCT
jgi:hypothetical protein